MKVYYYKIAYNYEITNGFVQAESIENAKTKIINNIDCIITDSLTTKNYRSDCDFIYLWESKTLN